MSQNPYESPQTIEPPVIGIKGNRDDLRRVARYQKGTMICMLAMIIVYIFMATVSGTLPEDLRVPVIGVFALAYLAAVIAAIVFTFLLAAQLYNPVSAVIYGLGMFVPCLNLLVLLLINGKATGVLKQNGIRVGFIGTNVSEI